MDERAQGEMVFRHTSQKHITFNTKMLLETCFFYLIRPF